MSMSPFQTLRFVVRPTLQFLALPGGRVAEQLVMGTAAQESNFVYLDQLEAAGRPVKTGPALGLWQMERITFDDMVDRYLAAKSRADLRDRVLALAAPAPTLWLQLATNLAFACALARVRYYARPFRMPPSAWPEDLALIWKRHYNTELGKGTTGEFIENFRRYVEPAYEEDARRG